MKDSPQNLPLYSELYAEIETLVVSGQHDQARKCLKAISPKALPREWAQKFAEFGNRVQDSIYTLKALHRFMDASNPFAPAPSELERMTYAHALCLLGAAEEALEVLASINSHKFPQAAFLKAQAYFRQWNYKESISFLKHYLAAPELPTYRRAIGEVNLIAALVTTQQWDLAFAQLSQTEKMCRENHFNLLHGNCLELKAQALFFQKRYAEAMKCLELAQILLKDQQGLYLLFVEKWKTLCTLFNENSPEPFPAKLKTLKGLAEKAKRSDDPETVRECELFEAIATENSELLRKVIMGTPSESYRQRARNLYRKPIRALGRYAWALDTESKEKHVVFDPYAKQAGAKALHELPQLLAVFEALTVDFYRPRHLGTLFKNIYPTEKFNPFSSPLRVLQSLKRLDQWFANQKVPLRVQFKKSEFRLLALTNVQVIVQRGKSLTQNEGRWSEVKSTLAGRTFTTTKISELLGVSKTSAQRLIQAGLKEGKLQSIGAGNNKRYQFATNKKGTAAA